MPGRVTLSRLLSMAGQSRARIPVEGKAVGSDVGTEMAALDADADADVGAAAEELWDVLEDVDVEEAWDVVEGVDGVDWLDTGFEDVS